VATYDGGAGHTANLANVDHVVVLMLENRSFDHMLGYLSLTGQRPDVDGLRPELANHHEGLAYPVHHLSATTLGIDPDHSAGAVDRQVASGEMSGFVASAAAALDGQGVGDGDPSCVMGYYDATDVPVYDHMAGEFALCDRWFSSVPGSTWPNRLDALCGAAAGSRDDRPPHCRRCMTSRRLSDTLTLIMCPGAGIPPMPGRFAWRTPATCWDIMISSGTSARAACRGTPW
jgi:phospholipase C